jgi:hypothetical protein
MKSFKLAVFTSVLLSISAPILFTASDSALAGCGFLDITCNPGKWDSPGKTIRDNVRDATFFSFNVHVRNNTNKRIYVTAEWYVIKPTQSCSTIDGSGENCGGPQWTSGTWLIEPGKESLIINDAKSRNIYFSGFSEDRKMNWTRKEVDMGRTYNNFYYSFTN